jgi:hypothetical protein
MIFSVKIYPPFFSARPANPTRPDLHFLCVLIYNSNFASGTWRHHVWFRDTKELFCQTWSWWDIIFSVKTCHFFFCSTGQPNKAWPPFSVFLVYNPKIASDTWGDHAWFQDTKELLCQTWSWWAIIFCVRDVSITPFQPKLLILTGLTSRFCVLVSAFIFGHWRQSVEGLVCGFGTPKNFFFGLCPGEIWL